MPPPSEKVEVPEGFWAEEVLRGGKEVLIVMFGAEPRGSIELASYEEKVAWQIALKDVNSILKK